MVPAASLQPLFIQTIRRCEGGHACSLYANGRKVAFVGPGILEWSSHSKMVDVLEWFAEKCSIKVLHTPTKLGDDWENKVPDHKNNPYETTEKRLVQWVGRHVLAYEIIQRCKTSLLCLDRNGEFYEYKYSGKEQLKFLLRLPLSWDKCFNEMTKEEILETVMTLKRVPRLLPEGVGN